MIETGIVSVVVFMAINVQRDISPAEIDVTKRPKNEPNPVASLSKSERSTRSESSTEAREEKVLLGLKVLLYSYVERSPVKKSL